ncbi:MAG: hypothetical protein KJ698_00995 [Actinobacteria bacterium]|nr:hypothetical protein [Actinomycetota bacterium]MBU1494201.1 hypothetical protein [Actinomycetota bacterium]
MVGYQVAHQIAVDLHPERIVIVSLAETDVDQAVEDLRALAPPGVEIIGEWGNVFVREEFSRIGRRTLIDDHTTRELAFEDMLGPIDGAYERSRLTHLIGRYRPDVVVDAINTATAISYQDVYTSAIIAERDVEAMLAGSLVPPSVVAEDIETLILSLTIPQLIRHVTILLRALREAGTRMYLKVGTSGTGGMGLDIPFTHSEDRPSVRLLTKNAVAFAHTGLLFLMARTDGPLVKEIKPSTLIGYSDLGYRTIRERGEPVCRYASHTEALGDRLELRMDPAGFDRQDELRLPVIDTGENGVFTKGEFEVVTALGMMEMVTPEEIAGLCVREIKGGNTGHDVIAALDGAVLGPTYRAGVLRARAMEQIRAIEQETGTHSVALGQLGPPELSKLLWEAELLKLLYGNPTAVLETDPAAIGKEAEALIEERTRLRETITSLGLPILGADGTTLRRGPFLRIPEVPGETVVEMTEADRDRWAAKGWIDLRPCNWEKWQERLSAMREARPGDTQRGSAGYAAETSLTDEIEIGAVVAWVVASEIGGSRIK